MRRTGLIITSLLLMALFGAGPALAGQADTDFQTVYQAFRKTGQIDPCAFSAQTLKSARKGVGADTGTYSPEFGDALDAALSRRASGACAKPAAAKDAGDDKTSSTPAGVGGPSAAAPGATDASGDLTPQGTASATPATPAAPAAAPGAAPGAAAQTATPAPAGAVVASPQAAADAVPTADLANARSESDDDTPAPLVGLGVVLVLALLAALAVLATRTLVWDPPWLARGRHASQEASWRASAAWAEFTDWVRIGR